MKKIISVCGPTAIGKTSFACSVAKELATDVISVDSRQVFKTMDIGTGKDIPVSSPFVINSTVHADNQVYDVGYFKVSGVNIWLYDLADPTQTVNAGVYRKAALLAIKSINHVPILVGGTGFYLNSIINPPESLEVPPNPSLRSNLDTLSVQELQTKLQVIDLLKLNQMNESDKANPRRLVRAIEVALHPVKTNTTKSVFHHLSIGLTAPSNVIKERIIKRVDQRINQDFDAEVKSLRNRYPDFHELQSGNALGYKEWGKYLNGEISQKEARELWITSEVQYSKRQMTWFKKQKDVIWFDILSDNWYAQANQTIQKWLVEGSHDTQN